MKGYGIHWRAVVAAFAVAAAAHARGQDQPTRGRTTDERIAELEKAVDEHQRTIDELKAKKVEPAAPEKEKSGYSFLWGYDDGFCVKGRFAGAPYELRPVARVQLDYRLFPYSHPLPNDQFLIRRAAVGFMGRFGDFGYDLEVDTVRGASGNPFGIVNFWFEWRSFNELKIRFGNFKQPWDLEDMMTSDNYLDFVERPMVVGSGNTVAPDFRPGVQVFGSIGGGLFQYWLGVTNPVDTNTVVSGDPMMSARVESDFAGLAIGAGGIWDRKAGKTQNSFPGLTPGFFQFFAPVLVHGWTHRYEVDACYYNGPFFARGEYVYAFQERLRVLANGNSGTFLVTQGMSATVGFMFWGPPRSTPRPHVVPFDGWELFSFDVDKKKNQRNVGMELVVRLEWMALDDQRNGRRNAVAGTAPNSDKIKGNDCKAVEIGINFYPIENVRFMADYVHMRIGDESRAERPSSRYAEEFLFRAQLEF